APRRLDRAPRRPAVGGAPARRPRRAPRRAARGGRSIAWCRAFILTTTSMQPARCWNSPAVAILWILSAEGSGLPATLLTWARGSSAGTGGDRSRGRHGLYLLLREPKARCARRLGLACESAPQYR